MALCITFLEEIASAYSMHEDQFTPWKQTFTVRKSPTNILGERNSIRARARARVRARTEKLHMALIDIQRIFGLLPTQESYVEALKDAYQKPY